MIADWQRRLAAEPADQGNHLQRQNDESLALHSIMVALARDRVQADLAYGVLIGEFVGCVATTSTLFWSDLSQTGGRCASWNDPDRR